MFEYFSVGILAAFASAPKAKEPELDFLGAVFLVRT